MRTFLPDQTRISQVHLRTADLKRALTFYAGVLGLNVLNQQGAEAALSASANGPELLVLTEKRDAPPRPPRATGLYHFALRYPGRQALARAYDRVVNTGYPVEGGSDHGVSEAIYLSDPEGNGIELYRDRPPAQWPRSNGQIAMVSEPLDLDELLALANDESASADPTLQPDIGHIHLHVPDLAAAERFYGEFLGLSVTQRSFPGALFLAAGGYHHHVGVNVWAGSSAPPAESVGLISYRFEVPVTELLYCLGHRAPLLGYETRSESHREGPPILQIRDVNGNWLEIQPSPTATTFEGNSRCCEGPESRTNRRHQERKMSYAIKPNT